LHALVHRVVDHCQQDGQLDATRLTLRDLHHPGHHPAVPIIPDPISKLGRTFPKTLSSPLPEEP
jgi:hypothetical protein